MVRDEDGWKEFTKDFEDFFIVSDSSAEVSKILSKLRFQEFKVDEIKTDKPFMYWLGKFKILYPCRSTIQRLDEEV